jgi:hypothetical protein
MIGSTDFVAGVDRESEEVPLLGVSLEESHSKGGQ